MSKKLRCPNCGHHIPLAKATHFNEYAVKRVLYAAREPERIGVLASVYKNYAKCSKLSARKAVERMAKDGYLRRVSQGVYVASTRVERSPR